MEIKSNKNNINGIIILDKPKDYTSNDCIQIIKKLLKPYKIGHTGTLDVNATGVLPCLIGTATKSQELLMSMGDKVYQAELILGISSDTEDITGEILNYENAKVDISSIEYFDFCFDDDKNLYDIINSFIGKYEQIPPMYSSKKINGKKLIYLARKGINIERKACNVYIKNIKITDKKKISFNLIKNNDVFKHLSLRCYNISVVCSKGTYIRTLCKDIGEKLGQPSIMGNLRRIKCGDFNIKDSITLEKIDNKVKNNDLSFVIPCLYAKNNQVVTFGKFETLHLGHQKIIKKVVEVAKKNNIESTVIVIVEKNKDRFLSNEQIRSKLDFFGIDNIMFFELNEYTKNISADEFLEKIIIKDLKAKAIVIGEDSTFGYMGKGNVDLLKTKSKENNIEAYILEKLKVKDVIKDYNSNTYISSSLIKEYIASGNIDFTSKLLGKE